MEKGIRPFASTGIGGKRYASREYFNPGPPSWTSGERGTDGRQRSVRQAGFPHRCPEELERKRLQLLSEEVYIYRDLFQAKSVGPYAFDQTITVLQNEFSSNINRIYKKRSCTGCRDDPETIG